MLKILGIIYLSQMLFASTDIDIYNSNIAFVKESKTIKGNNGKLIYNDISMNVVKDSVVAEFNPRVNIKTQVINNDLINLNKLLMQNIGKEIIHNGELAILISTNPILIKKGEFILNAEIKDLNFHSSENIKLKPNLVWTGDFKNQEYKVRLNYLTNGFDWRANYYYNLHNNNLIGVITINNNSGIDFNNVQVNCFAGDIHTDNLKPVMRTMMMESSKSQISSVEVSGYYLYPLPFKLDLKNSETIQVNFVNKNIKYKSYLKFNINTIANKKLASEKIIKFTPGSIPSGKIRFLDTINNELSFIGENSIRNISKDEDVEISSGFSYDIKGDVRFEKRNVNLSNLKEYKAIINIQNYSKDKQEVKIDIKNLNIHKQISFTCDKCEYKDGVFSTLLENGENKRLDFIFQY